MALKEFIFQGFTPRTHADAVRELFSLPEIKKVVLSVAFVSESGVDQIATQLKAHSSKVTVFAGIRNDITSYQGLKRLHAISGKLYAVDTGSRMVVFHPKFYMVRSQTHAKLLLGSANLTLGGLNNNIEAGMLLHLDLANPNDKAVVESIEAQLALLQTDYPGNILKIGSSAELDAMLASGRLVDEMAIPPPRPSTSAGSGGAGDFIGRIKLKTTPIRRALAKAKAAPKLARARKGGAGIAKIGAKLPVSPLAVGVEFELVWESKLLTQRDLSIPDAAGTHATGSINLDKGLLSGAVDQRHYFRDDVFPDLSWSPTKASGKVEEAFAKFQLVLKGISYGEFDLRIGHSTDITSKTYRQNNAMTRLSWGPMRAYVARTDLIGRTLALYRDKADPTRFVLEID
jgi:hypothetical protein